MTRRQNSWSRIATLGLLVLGGGACALSPKADFLSPETQTKISPSQHVESGGSGVQGVAFAGEEGLALWLAILGLVAAPVTGALAYEHIFRPRRIVKENGYHNKRRA